jgi:DNA-binding NarL/FixJ family response regulator
MKKALLSFAISLLFTPVSHAQYTDHRDHQLDSLEAVVAPWTEARVASATPEERERVCDAWNELMWGYSNINPSRSLYFARKTMSLSLEEKWLNQAFQAAKMIGQHHWAAGQIDSAKAGFAAAKAIADRMARKEPLPGKPNGYKQETIEDAYSGLYGALGNMYASIDSIPQAMAFYRKCGELLEKNGWNESSSVLYHNMGETWLGAGNIKEAEACYNKSLQFAQQAEDSLLIAEARAGLGAFYLEQGKTAKALVQLKAADEYFSTHEDQEYRNRLYTLDLSGKVLEVQKKQRTAIAIGSAILSLVLIALLVLLFKALRLSREKKAADAVIEEVMAESKEKTLNSAPIHTGKPALTDREREILPLMAEGLTNKAIASKLFLSEQTIKWYRMRLNEKFNAKNAAELIAKAKEQGII